MGPVKEYTGDKQVYDEKKAPDVDDVSDGAKGKPAKPPAPDPAVDKWAVVIGISDYRGAGNDLQYCDDDANDMYNYLLAKGYPSGNIKLIKDSKATARSILAAIDWMNNNEKQTSSECVFFYSGHGSTYDGYNDGDAEYTDETIVSSDLYLVLDGQLTAKFSTFTSQKIAFIFDSCFSGGMDDMAGAGRAVVSACSETELSWDGSAAQQNGVFTYYYMTGLGTYNTVEGAFDYAAPLATKFAYAEYDATMTPQKYDQYVGDWTF
jgi:hypothetical protein